ncbi:uncharacterized protein BYT42DRAFT_581382 [Radiomyces spectabilis]|uniref:uncharacterized protein n=1 Tax=Radiomyces spectabilis TaxID=64574 RepID=UPI002220C755|nr:uncharacterized protein BYT42DRAFT_581382 [Radiomyces spectabilis]KAI8371751.1 hypothetical protein BYT42DRAFT_581382 [Radiomyces spectabilis]
MASGSSLSWIFFSLFTIVQSIHISHCKTFCPIIIVSVFILGALFLFFVPTLYVREVPKMIVLCIFLERNLHFMVS